MLPSGYPGVICDGVEALRWAAAVYERAQGHVPELVREARSDLEAAAQRHRGEPTVVFMPTEAGTTGEFRRMQHELEQIAQRLDSATDAQWASGYAAGLFTPVDLGVLQSWEDPGPSPLLVRLGIAPADVEVYAIHFRALRQWLEAYTESNE